MYSQSHKRERDQGDSPSFNQHRAHESSPLVCVTAHPSLWGRTRCRRSVLRSATWQLLRRSRDVGVRGKASCRGRVYRPISVPPCLGRRLNTLVTKPVDPPV